MTDTGEADGTPVVQASDDPCPGAFVSATALHLPGMDGKPLPRSSPFKYVDSATVPFVVVPPMIIKGVVGVVLGCRAVVTNTVNGKSVEAVVADSGGTESRVVQYRLFPGVAAHVGGVTYPLQHS